MRGVFLGACQASFSEPDCRALHAQASRRPSRPPSASPAWHSCAHTTACMPWPTSGAARSMVGPDAGLPLVSRWCQGPLADSTAMRALPSCTTASYEVRQRCRSVLQRALRPFAEREPERPCTQASSAPAAPAVLTARRARQGRQRQGARLVGGRAAHPEAEQLRRLCRLRRLPHRRRHHLPKRPGHCGAPSPYHNPYPSRPTGRAEPPAGGPGALLCHPAARSRLVRSYLPASRRAAGSTPVPAPPRVT